ncbi:MAG: hypothetical protein ABR586_01325 [Thermoplasmatota archaeon]
MGFSFPNPFDPNSYSWVGPTVGVVGDSIGNVGAVALGGLGAAGGGITGLVTGEGLDGFGQGWNAGASFSPLGQLGDQARAQVRSTYARLDANPNVPEWLKVGATVLGPPQTQLDAWISLGGSALGGGYATRAANRAGAEGAGALARIFGWQAAKDAAGALAVGEGLHYAGSWLSGILHPGASTSSSPYGAPPAGPGGGIGLRGYAVLGVAALTLLAIAARRR